MAVMNATRGSAQVFQAGAIVEAVRVYRRPGSAGEALRPCGGRARWPRHGRAAPPAPRAPRVPQSTQITRVAPRAARPFERRRVGAVAFGESVGHVRQNGAAKPAQQQGEQGRHCRRHQHRNRQTPRHIPGGAQHRRFARLPLAYRPSARGPEAARARWGPENPRRRPGSPRARRARARRCPAPRAVAKWQSPADPRPRAIASIARSGSQRRRAPARHSTRNQASIGRIIT